MLMCVGCFGLVVSTCQVIGWKDPSDDSFMWVEILSPQSPGGRECLCFFSLGLLMLLCVFPGPTQYIFHTSMAGYSLFVLKVPLNTKKTNKQTNKSSYACTFRLMDMWVPNMKFDCRFVFCRLPLRLQHRAVELAFENSLGDFLFPTAATVCSRDSPIIPLDRLDDIK